MSKQINAIALCRVSSIEQLENNSLPRQKESVLRAAAELNVTIPDDGWWSGNMSSKKGTNLTRPDLLAMLDYCKHRKSVRYLIVDRPDRFMRSIEEAIHYEVEFSKLGVKVWYASDKELNQDNLMAKFLKFTRYFSAEGSNDDRIEQSIGGAVGALKEGRWPFAPKAGYMRGREKAVPEIHPVRGPALQRVLLDMVNKRISPAQGLINLNNGDFMQDGHSPYKMDKFRNIATDSFYAGVVEIDKQVKHRNVSGLHDPLITLEQHEELVRVFAAKKKNQNGPRKNGNPEFPLNNIVSCELCVDKTNGRYVGYNHGNGTDNGLVYQKYRCRGCNGYLSRQDLHIKITDYIQSLAIDGAYYEYLLEALNHVWKQEESQTEQDVARISHKINVLNQAVRDQVEAATDRSNLAIKDDILASVIAKKTEIVELQNTVAELRTCSKSLQQQRHKSQ